MSELCGENYEIQCGEVFLHLMNGKLSFHCTLCECKYDGYQNYAAHIASEHSPSVECEEDVIEGNIEEILEVAHDDELEEETLQEESRFNIKEEIQIKEEPEYLFEENSYNSFADEYDQEDEDYLNEPEIVAEELRPQNIFADSKTSEGIGENTVPRKRSRGLKPHPVVIPTENARPVKIKYINKDDDRKFRCPNCDFSCKLKRNLKGHLRRHAKERPFPCSYCEKGFYTTTELKVHMRVHTGERPFTCLECGDSFITIAKLKEHARIHEEFSPRFQCESCGKAFNTASRLRVHRNSCVHKKDKPHKCPTCNASFENSIDLRNHSQLHEIKKKYECVLCEAQFDDRPRLNSHLQTKHMSIYL